jgi:hypothetical protein
MSGSLEQTTGTGIVSEKGSVCTSSAIAKWASLLTYSPIQRRDPELGPLSNLLWRTVTGVVASIPMDDRHSDQPPTVKG